MARLPPMSRLEWLNSLPEDNAREELHRCCGSLKWARAVALARPFETDAELFARAETEWRALDRKDMLEAFSHHPRIGGSQVKTDWAKQEQSGVTGAASNVLDELARLNEEYEKKFGFVYLVCATGKSAPEMLGLLVRRMGNQPDDEFPIAAGEQLKIMRIRLEKLLK